jgi:DNA repair exonuclease SbcCD ATPase subunit
MRLLRLQLEHFRSYDQLDLPLEQIDHAAVCGANGSGKSSILKAIAWVCWGEGSSDELVDYSAKQMGVTLTFVLAGVIWEVSRGRERGRKSWLSLREQIGTGPGGPVWATRSGKTIAETQVALDRVLGMGHDAFAASVYSPQGKIGALVDLRPGERKALLAGLLGLDEWEHWRVEAATQARVAAAAVARARAEQEAPTASLPALRAKILPEPERVQGRADELVRSLQVAEGDLSAAIERSQGAERVRLRLALVERMRKLKDDSITAQAQNKRRDELDLELAAKDAAVAALEREQGHRRAYEERVTEARARYEAARSAIAEKSAEAQRLKRDAEAAMADAEAHGDKADKLNARARAPHDVSDVCPTCQQALGVDAHQQVALQLGEQAKQEAVLCQDALKRAGELSVRLDAIEVALAPISAPAPPTVERGDYDEERLAAAAAAVAQLQVYAGQSAALGPKVDVEAMRAEWADLRDQAATLPLTVEPGPTPDQVRGQMSRFQGELEEARRLLAEHHAAEQRAVDLEAVIERAFAEERDSSERQRSLEVCARAFSRDGIPAMIMDGVVGVIETAANRHLDELGSHMRLTLATQRLTKAKTLSETLEVLVDDGASERPIETYSGGEQYRLHIAIRLALAEALAGQTPDCLLIDEVTDLDADGVQQLVEILRNVDKQVILVSHQDEFIAAMPQKLMVSRAGPLAASEVLLG